MVTQWRRTAIGAALIAICFDFSAARASAFDMPQIDAEKIITSCRDGVDPSLNFGVTTDRMQGSMEYRECLKKALLANWQKLSRDKKSEAEFAKQLDDFTNPFIQIVNTIFLGNKTCPCGTFYNDYYSQYTAEVYEMLLHGMAEASN